MEKKKLTALPLFYISSFSQIFKTLIRHAFHRVTDHDGVHTWPGGHVTRWLELTAEGVYITIIIDNDFSQVYLNRTNQGQQVQVVRYEDGRSPPLAASSTHLHFGFQALKHATATTSNVTSELKFVFLTTA